MNQQHIVMLCVGLAFIVLGTLLSANPKVARWGVTHGRGRIWAAMLGEERAVKLTRYFFGPLVVVLGLFALIGAIAGP